MKSIFAILILAYFTFGFTSHLHADDDSFKIYDHLVDPYIIEYQIDHVPSPNIPVWLNFFLKRPSGTNSTPATFTTVHVVISKKNEVVLDQTLTKVRKIATGIKATFPEVGTYDLETDFYYQQQLLATTSFPIEIKDLKKDA